MARPLRGLGPCSGFSSGGRSIYRREREFYGCGDILIIAADRVPTENTAVHACLNVALAQHETGCDPARIVADARTAGADVVVFPEMYSNGYARFDPTSIDQWRKGAVSPEGAFVDRFREAARALQIHVVATFLEAAEPKPYNSALLIAPNGQTILHHRKVHICDFDNPESACGRGNGFSVAQMETTAGDVKVGIMICMDREYSEAAMSLSRAGAEIVLVPNCCHLVNDPIVGDVRVAQARGRAFEAVMGMGVANYPAPYCDGHSFAVDPKGSVIAMADGSPGITIASFDLPKIRKTREEERFRWRL